MDASRKAYIHSTRPELQQYVLSEDEDLFAARQQGAAVHEYELNGAPIMEFIIPIQSGIEPWGFLRLGFSLDALHQEIAHSKKEIGSQVRGMIFRSLLTSLVFIVLGSVIVLAISTSLSQPLIRLTRFTRQLAQGQFVSTDDLMTNTRDEVGILATGFAEMADNLRISYEKLEDYSKTLAQKVSERTRELRARQETSE